MTQSSIRSKHYQQDIKVDCYCNLLYFQGRISIHDGAVRKTVDAKRLTIGSSRRFARHVFCSRNNSNKKLAMLLGQQTLDSNEFIRSVVTTTVSPNSFEIVAKKIVLCMEHC